ncbi:MAG: hypothetical protein ABI894_13380 [Ilumatobacteraceae bacterium]
MSVLLWLVLIIVVVVVISVAIYVVRKVSSSRFGVGSSFLGSEQPVTLVPARDVIGTVGSVKGLSLDSVGHRIEAIHFDRYEKRAIVLEWSAAASLGVDAVMASSGDEQATINDARRKSAINGDVTMIGTRRLTIDGLNIGTVEDVEFETDSGIVVRVVTDQGLLEPDQLRAAGSSALVVDPSPASMAG